MKAHELAARQKRQARILQELGLVGALPNEVCQACGREKPCPMIGVTFEGNESVAYPICLLCYWYPPRPLKVHYFLREQKALALAAAGSSSIG